MMPWVHASVGALLGSLAPSRKKAFGVGAVSHGVADLFPHRDYSLLTEAPMLAVTLTVIAFRFGLTSREMAGALGAIAPDAENGLERLGLIKTMIYPTHTKKFWFIGHGRAIKNPLTQVILAFLCLSLAHTIARRRKV